MSKKVHVPMLAFAKATHIEVSDSFGEFKSKLNPKATEITEKHVVFRTKQNEPIRFNRDWLDKERSNSKVLVFTRQSGEYAMLCKVA